MKIVWQEVQFDNHTGIIYFSFIIKFYDFFRKWPNNEIPYALSSQYGNNFL